MKKLLFMIVAVGALLTACNNNDTEYVYDDHSADLVGTWTCLTNDFAEALVISADGKVVSTGVAEGEYWEDVNGTIAINEGTITLTFEDGDNFEGHFDIIPGVAFSIYNDKGDRLVYNYCANDLADEVVGMWVCTQTDLPESNMTIQTYNQDGTVIVTGFSPEVGKFEVNGESTYKVIGNLMIQKTLGGMNGGSIKYFPTLLTYTPNGTAFGDILSTTGIVFIENKYLKSTFSWLRIKQSLDLAEKSYDYNNVYVTNVKGVDQDFEYAGQTLNFSTIDGVAMGKLMKHILFNVSFPAADTISYNCYFNGKNVSIEAPIEVDGNKMTIKMSDNNSVYRDIDLYTFQDANNTQMHMYMPTTSFEKFIANIGVVMMAKNGELDLNDEEAVEAIFAGVETAIETINVSFIFKSSTRAF